MADITMVKMAGNLLRPMDESDSELLDAWEVGDVIRVKATKERNGRFHRKAMALLRVVFENQERYETFEDLLTEFKLRAGWYREHVTLKGNMIYVPKSISFAELDEPGFEVLYSKWVDIALKYFVPNWSKDDLEGAMNILLGFM